MATLKRIVNVPFWKINMQNQKMNVWEMNKCEKKSKKHIK